MAADDALTHEHFASVAVKSPSKLDVEVPLETRP